MLDIDSMGPDIQPFESDFRISFQESYHKSSNFPECRYFTKFKWPYFRTARRYSHVVSHVGNTRGILHADMTLIRSKVEVKVTWLLNFRHLPITAHF